MFLSKIQNLTAKIRQQSQEISEKNDNNNTDYFLLEHYKCFMSAYESVAEDQ